MLFPYLEKSNEKSIQTSVFFGLNRTESQGMGELSDMLNVTSDNYPNISQSAKLNAVQINPEIKKIQACIKPPETEEQMSGFTGVADGRFYFNDKQIPFAYSFMSIDEDSDVFVLNFADMIVILPQLYSFQYKNTEMNHSVYPMLAGSYDEYITVTSTGAPGESVRFTKEAGTRSWEDMGISVGDSLIIQTDEQQYSSLNVYMQKDKYDRSRGSDVVYNAIVDSVSAREIGVKMLNYDGKALGITDNAHEGIRHEFKRTLRVYKRAPLFDSACIYANRIWATEKNGECIYASAPGKPYEFFNFSGLSTDSWYTEVAEDGAFTGISALRDGVVAFKKNKIYHIFGDRPTNFNIAKQFSNIGCIDKNSVSGCDSSVVFASFDGIYEYSGTAPVNISKKLGIKKYMNVNSFSDGKKIYLSINNEPKIYVYTRDMGLWHIEGDFAMKGCFVFKNSLYFVTDCAIFNQSRDFSNNWFITLCDITENDIRHKGINDIFIRVKNFENSKVRVLVSTNGGDYRLCGMADSFGDYTFRVPVRFIKGDKYSIKISGEGRTYIKDIQRSFYIGGAAFTRKG